MQPRLSTHISAGKVLDHREVDDMPEPAQIETSHPVGSRIGPRLHEEESPDAPLG